MDHNLPISKRRLTAIGDRLRASTATAEEIGQWNDCLIVYQDVVEDVKGILGRAGLDETLKAFEGADLNITGRVKTRTTLLEKLQRQPELRLAVVQDVAGVRVEGAMTLTEQDEIAARITSLFEASRQTDRRVTPVQGYRALHVIVTHDGLPCEIQIRTHLQHAWANCYEKLGDLAGRSIRYGDAGTPVAAPGASPEMNAAIEGLRQGILDISDLIRDIEAVGIHLPNLRSVHSDEADEAVAKYFASSDRLAKSLVDLAERVENMRRRRVPTPDAGT